MFYLNCIALSNTCHSNSFVSHIETGIAQSLHLLGYVLSNWGHRVRFRPCKRHSYTVSRFFWGSSSLVPIWYRGLFPLG